jgi:RNA polymerase sigma factor (sigma-70 family)
MTAVLEKNALERRQVLDSDRLFETFYCRYEGDVYRLARQLVGGREDAEDVTQIAFLNAYRALARGAPPRKPRPWLLAIARNVCSRRFRTQQNRPREVELDPEAVEARAGSDGATVAELRAAMERLSFEQRSALGLREFKALSYADIAAALGLSVSAVEALLFRARRALRHELEQAQVMPSVCASDGRKRRALGGLLPWPAWLGKPFSWFGSLGGGGLSWKAAGVTAAAVMGTGAAVGTGVVSLGLSVTGNPPAAPSVTTLPAARFAPTPDSAEASVVRADIEESSPTEASLPEPPKLNAPSSAGQLVPESRRSESSHPSTLLPDAPRLELPKLEPPRLPAPALPEQPKVKPPPVPAPARPEPPKLEPPPLPEPPKVELPSLPAPPLPPPPALPLP